jgi:MoaA/NifB/PqqE/SkfB family radical SAM enzyme
VNAEIKLGTACNNNCIFCLNEPGRMFNKPTRTIKYEVVHLKEKGVGLIKLTGGEPTIREDFFEIIRFARSNGLEIEIQTNGRALAYDWFAKKTADVGIRNFLISLHAHHRELYKELSNTDGYEQVMMGIKNLKSLDQKFSINVVITSKNLHHLREIAEHHSRLGAESIQLSWAKPEGKTAADMRIFPKYSDNILSLSDAVDALLEKGQRVAILGVPHCILGNYAKYAGRPYKGMFVESGSAEDLFNEEKKLLTAECAGCLAEDACGGLFKKYHDFFGADETKRFTYPTSHRPPCKHT